jgi:hypothetical protein
VVALLRNRYHVKVYYYIIETSIDGHSPLELHPARHLAGIGALFDRPKANQCYESLVEFGGGVAASQDLSAGKALGLRA